MKNKFIVAELFKSKKLLVVILCVILLIFGYINESTFGQLVMVYLGVNVAQKFSVKRGKQAIDEENGR